MHKSKINYKMLNILIIVSIVVLVYLIKDLWIGIVSKILSVLAPFLIAFVVAYALYPLVKKLINLGLPKWLSIMIICLLGLGFLATIVLLIVPMLYDQTLLFLSNISVFISDISSKYEINLGVLQTSISDISSGIIKGIGKYISDGAINVVNTSISVLTNLVIVLFSAVYFLIDMDKIRDYVKQKLKGRRNKCYRYVKVIDEELNNYFVGLGQNILVQLFEYTFVFFIIGHPNYLVLGILASFTTIIPYFGAFIVDVLAVLIASVVSTKLLILTLCVLVICPLIDGYVISPKIYGKTNKIHPLVSIFAVFAGGILGGFWGIVVSLPVAIIIIATFKFFLPDINNKLIEIKNK